MQFTEYIEQKKLIQNYFLCYINNEINIEENFQNLIKTFKDYNIEDDRQELERIIYLIMHISNNHRRYPNYFEKIEKIIQYLKNAIIKNFSNSVIFDLFKGNKRILLHLFKENILTPCNFIIETMLSDKYKNFNYHTYFYTEINPSFTREDLEGIGAKDLIDFENKRRIGENEDFLSEMIRNDMIDEFISHVKRNNMSLNSTIKTSIFETNSFLLKKNEHSLIEYSAFFGSMQIFKFLNLNGVKLNEDLCLYAIHGYNPEMIHYLEENKIYSREILYIKTFYESIKCHHNEIANYIQMNYLPKNFDAIQKIIKYSNYLFFPIEINNELSFYYFCEYNYVSIVKILLETKSIDINKKVISKL